MGNKTEYILAEAPIKKVFTNYALPSVVSLLFVGIQTVIDGIVVGNFVGADALGGVNIIMPLFSALMVIGLIIGVGCQSIVGISFGQNDKKRAQDALTTGFVALLVTAIILTAIVLVYAKPLISLMGADESLMVHSLDYIKGFTPFVLSMFILFYSDYMLKATGHPKKSMVIMSSTVIINIVLNLFFVIVMKMGTMGVSLGTGISFTIGAIATGFTMFSRKNKIYMTGGSFKWRLLWNAFYNGSSEGVAELSTSLTVLLINITLMKHIGAMGVSAFTIINYIYFVGILIFLGISDGIIPVLSYNFGAKNYKRLWAVRRYFLVINFLIGLTAFIVMTVWGNSIVSLFIDDANTEILEIAIAGLTIYAFAFLINGSNILTTSFFTAMGDAKNSIIVSLSRGIAFVAVGIAIFPAFMGSTGIWISIPFAEIVTLGLSVFILNAAKRRMGYKKMSI